MNKIKKSYLTGTEESPGLWDGQPSIFCKYDWFTCVFNDVSLKDVLDCIQFFDYDNDDYLKCFSQRILTSVGALPEISLNFNGAHINLRYESLLYLTGSVDLADLDPYKVLNTCLPYIRLDISGSGLDYFRSIGISIDTILNKPFDLPYGSYHPTRADIAFDLIDYAPDFLDQCKEACHRLAHKDTGRVPAQSNGGIKWSERGGDQNTLYLGSVGSDRLLRIYDKKLQFMNAKKFVSSCPYRNGDQLLLPGLELSCRFVVNVNALMCYMILTLSKKCLDIFMISLPFVNLKLIPHTDVSPVKLRLAGFCFLIGMLFISLFKIKILYNSGSARKIRKLYLRSGSRQRCSSPCYLWKRWLYPCRS